MRRKGTTLNIQRTLFISDYLICDLWSYPKAVENGGATDGRGLGLELLCGVDAPPPTAD
jgi:hypothetical protein